MQFLQHKLLTASLFAFTSKNTTDLCVIKNLFSVSNMKHTFHNILLISCPRHPLFYNGSSLPVTLPSAEGRICNTLSKNSVECVNNHIKGAVMIETIFIGMATALQLLRDDSTLFALAIILPTPERKSIYTTTPTAMVGAYGFKIANELTKAAHRL
jgi:hypothetical protein